MNGSGDFERDPAARRGSITLCAACLCLPTAAEQTFYGPQHGIDRPLRGDEFTKATVADGSEV